MAPSAWRRVQSGDLVQGLTVSSPDLREHRSPWHTGGVSCLYLDLGKLPRDKQCLQTEAGKMRRSRAAVSLTSPMAPSTAMDMD